MCGFSCVTLNVLQCNLHTHTGTKVQFIPSSWSLYELSATCYLVGHIVIGSASAAPHQTDGHIYDVARNDEDNMHKLVFWKTSERKNKQRKLLTMLLREFTSQDRVDLQLQSGRGDAAGWTAGACYTSYRVQACRVSAYFRIWTKKLRWNRVHLLKYCTRVFGAIWFFHSTLWSKFSSQFLSDWTFLCTHFIPYCYIYTYFIKISGLFYLDVFIFSKLETDLTEFWFCFFGFISEVCVGTKSPTFVSEYWFNLFIYLFTRCW